MNTNFIEKQKGIAKAFSNEHESNYYEEDAWFFTTPALDTLTETIIKNTLGEVRKVLECSECDGSGIYQTPSDYSPCRSCGGTGLNTDGSLDDQFKSLLTKIGTEKV